MIGGEAGCKSLRVMRRETSRNQATECYNNGRASPPGETNMLVNGCAHTI